MRMASTQLSPQLSKMSTEESVRQENYIDSSHVEKSMAWETLAITLNPESNRFKDFKKNNYHLSITPYQAIKGSELSKEEVIRLGLATEELLSSTLLTNGALGCAASHRDIWKRCNIYGKGIFVMEDDCFTHPRINEFIFDNFDLLMTKDICFFGINTDSILESVSPQGLTTLSLFQPNYPGPEWIYQALTKTDVARVEIHKLLKAFGTCAYFVSPHGASKLDEYIFPLSLKTTNIPLINDKMPLVSIDRSGCSAYVQLEAMICHPFLAYSPNSDSSTQ